MGTYVCKPLKKLIQRQNDGRVTRIYTKKMEDRFRADLEDLKEEYGISRALTAAQRADHA
ncbi:MAG: hypothetical protein F4218_10110 [Synechococcus sp. SB0677_bin_5]|nr:hypothetical protein [Synechococcus sp. SB0677_bin_5]